MDPQTEPVRYVCGDCGKETTLKPGDRVQCGDCGYGVLYKRRTRRILEYEARLYGRDPMSEEKCFVHVCTVADLVFPLYEIPVLVVALLLIALSVSYPWPWIEAFLRTRVQKCLCLQVVEVALQY
ncbi:hypothetical protein Taro_014343 [Colocasia esculenta]|uniref:Uncharacterized protein n=1 Tax=Colocasia esculenta TaxID=4460 RepID=A0A843UIK6_COLES|nr:hypothetical protein [Colocasia esculenta]